MVLRRCRQLLGEQEQAVDAMQDTFVRVLRQQHRLHDAAPGGLLYQVATNICLNLLRGRNRHPGVGQTAVEELTDSSDREARLLAELSLDSIFRREPLSTRTMAVLHWVDGMTLDEVARETGFSVSGVRRRLRKLREWAVRLRDTAIIDV